MSSWQHEEEFARSLARIAENDPTFTMVNFGGWGIGDEGAMRLIEALRGNTVVIHLWLANNGISGALVTALVGVLESITSLTWLDLSGNDIGDLGAVAVERYLRNNSSVKHLYMRNCGIGVEGARALAEALPSNSTLTTLGLGRNSFGDEGTSLLAGALPGHLSLVYLFLEGNGISDVGAIDFAEALQTSSLTLLDLSGNDISDVGGRLLAKALLVNCTVTLVHLFGNTSREIERLVEELYNINSEASNPQEALGRKIAWLRNLDDGDLRLLGFEARNVEEEILRLEVVCKVVWLIDSGVASEKAEAVSLVLTQLEHFMRADQRRGLFWLLLGSNKHGEDVALSAGVTLGRALYWYAAQCGAAPGVLMNILRAYPSLCTSKDVEHRLYPFMLLATMAEAGVEDVMELLQMNPNLVEGGI